MALQHKLAWGVLIAGALVVSYEFAPSTAKVDLIEPAKRQAAVELKLKDVNGTEVKLSDYKDKVVLLNFWATWCAPCQVEIPWFKEFEQTYKDRGFAVLGVSADEEGWAVVKPYIQAKKMNYQVVLDDQKMPAPYKDVEALPSTYFIDRLGRVAAVHTGLVSKGTYEESIQALLKD
ncbi:MAG: TlpA disulfide reductase family protein [Acidobacteriota bacterium]